MKSNPFLSISFVALLLVGTPGAALAQAQVQEQDPHHPEQIEQAPAAQPDMPGAPESGMPGMMGRGMGGHPEMMRMMQRMMRMQDMEEADMPGMGMPAMMGMGHGMPGRGMMGHGMMDHGAMHDGMTRLIFILMDTDSDEALSLDEVQAVTERLFNAFDADDDGRITLDEIREFYRGPEDADRMRMRDRMPMRQGMQMQDGMMPQGMMDQAAATQAYMEAMQTMRAGMAGLQMTGDPARDFTLMMIPHHQSAIDMAEAFLEHSDNPELTQLANEIIVEQRREIEFLENWLREQDQDDR